MDFRVPPFTITQAVNDVAKVCFLFYIAKYPVCFLAENQLIMSFQMPLTLLFLRFIGVIFFYSFV